MAEKYTRPTEADKTNWNSDGTTYPSTDPGGSKRATGFKPKDVPVAGDGEIILANDANWLHGLEMEMVTYFRDYLVREWDELSEGIAASSYRDILRVMPPSGGMRRRFDNIYLTATVATGSGEPKSLATDGLRVYYISGTSNRYIVAVSPVDGQDGAAGGVPLWEINPSATVDVQALCTDGVHVYYVLSGTVTGLQIVDADDGGSLSTIGSLYGHNKLRANGRYVAGIAGSAGQGYVDIWDHNTASLVASINTTSTLLRGVAIDDDYVYVGGDRSTYDVWAYLNGSGTNAWQVTIDTNATIIRDIAADGDYVYVGTDRFSLAGGGSANLFCLERFTGKVLWSADLGSSIDCDVVAVDDEYIYSLDATTNNIYMLRKNSQGPASGSPGILKIAATVGLLGTDTIACDGVSIFTNDSGTANRLRRINTATATKLYMRVNGSDEYRRPFANLAVPISGRV